VEFRQSTLENMGVNELAEAWGQDRCLACTKIVLEASEEVSNE
jgi:hypothetical protein